MCRLLHYEPLTGEFIWKISSGRCKAGTIAGTEGNHGYIQIQIKGKIYLAHRLAWLYTHGNIENEIDHKNRIRIDNRITNLRPATSVQNRMNSEVRIDSATGLKGVTRCRDKFQARITVNGQKQHLGTFDTAEEAGETYERAAKEAFGERFGET